MRLTRLLLCRHAEADASVRGRICGSLDPGLSAMGHRQAAALAAAFEPVELGAVYASTRRRALDTARTVAARHGLEVVALPELGELDFGVLEGLTYDEAARRYPDTYRAWMEEPARVRFPGGESYGDVRERTNRALGQILRRHRAETVAVVTHGGVVRAAMAGFLGLAVDAAFRLDQGYGAVNVVEALDGRPPLVRLVNADPAQFRRLGAGGAALYSRR